MKAQTFFAGCGLGIALTLAYLWELLAPAQLDAVYLRVLPVATVAGGVAIDLAVVSLAAWAVLALSLQRDPELGSVLWILPFALVPAMTLRSVCTLAELPVRIPSTLILFLMIGVPAAVLWRFARRAWRRAVKSFLWICACLGVSIVWVLPQLVSKALHTQAPEPQSFEASSQAVAVLQPQKRIVWILFDELSYDQTYEKRATGLELPAFDRLRAESVVFADVVPAGYYTDQIIPALLRGRPVAAIRSQADGHLELREQSAGAWQSFDPTKTLLADAHNLGWRTAIAGWFNPYCRIFRGVVDSCLWEPESWLFPGHMSQANSAWGNALAPLMVKVSTSRRMLADEHREAYRVLLERARNLIADPSLRFVFVHLPVPHPPGIYRRATNRQENGGSYLDNLALADRTLAELRTVIEHTPDANTTMLIVSSDHSLRVPKWRGGQYWTREDERTFGARFDPRPVLAVHFPGQAKASVDRRAFDELRTYALVEGLLHGEIGSADGLQRWCDGMEVPKQ